LIGLVFLHGAWVSAAAVAYFTSRLIVDYWSVSRLVNLIIAMDNIAWSYHQWAEKKHLQFQTMAPKPRWSASMHEGDSGYERAVLLRFASLYNIRDKTAICFFATILSSINPQHEAN